ncbi:Met-10+ like-protein-domain-containing protein [Hygrophoropsis aurantiaca]|uniref:Met-10+ like-protein-domain-containing protein n=1 Tax=Hygrophoropsis aurantiaca TaxID=72124 RepID=A0ACB8ABE8_9AGAM|nr:Met-10+ like-protein-domain-containing protein [Hygrophoropsis aurantiaca]
MSRHFALDTTPPVQRLMTNLDRDVFQKTIPVLAARIPASKTGSVLKSEAMKRSIIDLPKVRSVVPDPVDPQTGRLLLLRVSENAGLPPESIEYLNKESFSLTTYTLKLDYDYWTADEILHCILPEELCQGSPSGFAITGHLAHMNLNKEYLPYKHIIGQVILDKNRGIKTVVNKLDSIDTQFRFFKMELLAGEPNYIVEHHESDCKFTFDFTRVYWNSRLHTEHDRLVQLFQPEDVIADVFAGVGPFAIPAARKGCAVFANDLNPNSAKYLAKNIVDNKVTGLVRTSCDDGRNFIRTVLDQISSDPFPAYTGPRESRSKERAERRKLQQERALRISSAASDDADPVISPELPLRSHVTHFVMNLPDSAIEFLDAFRGILAPHSQDVGHLSGIYATMPMPMIHCHCFTRELEPDKADVDIKRRVEEKLEHQLVDGYSLHMVRSVAPNKDMYCISFRLPREVAFAQLI